MAFVAEVAAFLLIFYLANGLLTWFKQKQRALKTFTSASIPGPVPSFWTGNSREYIREYHVALDKWVKQFGPQYGYFRSDSPYLVLSDVDEVNELLVKLGKAFPNRERPPVSMEPFASSLIDARGEKWKHARRVLTPPFTAHKMSLASTRSVINNSINRFLAEVEKSRRASGQIDLAYYAKSITLDIISRSAFSMDETDVYEPNSHLHEITAAIMEDTANIVLTWTTYLPFLKRLVYLSYEYVGKYTLRIIQHLNVCIEQYYAKKKCHTGNQKERKENILDFMLEQKELGNLSELEVMGNAIIILVAGYDTTATGLIFALYLLAKHQDIQRQLREEVGPIKAANPENHCIFDENRSELLDRVWNETLRLYPPVVTFLTRQIDDEMEDIQLSKSGTIVTKEMTVQIPVWTIHHDSSAWPEPNRYNPYRENLPIPGATKQNKAFLAFGAGPRNCIGSLLALTEARAVISSLVAKYHIELADAEEADALDHETGLLKLMVFSSVIIHPVKNIYLKLTPI